MCCGIDYLLWNRLYDVGTSNSGMYLQLGRSPSKCELYTFVIIFRHIPKKILETPVQIELIAIQSLFSPPDGNKRN